MANCSRWVKVKPCPLAQCLVNCQSYLWLPLFPQNTPALSWYSFRFTTAVPSFPLTWVFFILNDTCCFPGPSFLNNKWWYPWDKSLFISQEWNLSLILIQWIFSNVSDVEHCPVFLIIKSFSFCMRRERLRKRDFLNTEYYSRVNQRHFGGKRW